MKLETEKNITVKVELSLRQLALIIGAVRRRMDAVEMQLAVDSRNDVDRLEGLWRELDETLELVEKTRTMRVIKEQEGK